MHAYYPGKYITPHAYKIKIEIIGSKILTITGNILSNNLSTRSILRCYPSPKIKDITKKFVKFSEENTPTHSLNSVLEKK